MFFFQWLDVCELNTFMKYSRVCELRSPRARTQFSVCANSILCVRELNYFMQRILSSLFSSVSHMWRSRFMNESCHIWMSHVTYEWVMSHMDEWVMSHMNESCLIRISYVTYEWVMSYVWMCAWLIYGCARTQFSKCARIQLSNAASYSFLVSWCVCDMTHLLGTWLKHIWMCAWLMYECARTQFSNSASSSFPVSWCVCDNDSSFRDMTHGCVWHDSFICVTCLIHMCDMTHSYVWHDSSFRDVTHTYRILLVHIRHDFRLFESATYVISHSIWLLFPTPLSYSTPRTKG